jgi:hypothetical protein
LIPDRVCGVLLGFDEGGEVVGEKPATLLPQLGEAAAKALLALGPRLLDLVAVCSFEGVGWAASCSK